MPSWTTCAPPWPQRPAWCCRRHPVPARPPGYRSPCATRHGSAVGRSSCSSPGAWPRAPRRTTWPRRSARRRARRLAIAPGSIPASVSRTRIEVVTEGILTRMISTDPALEEYGLVIFDEFHERSLHADLGLALALESQAILRPELRILVMSATLDGERVSRLLGNAPVVTSVGRSFPVELRYAARQDDGRIEGRVARAVADALARRRGRRARVPSRCRGNPAGRGTAQGQRRRGRAAAWQPDARPAGQGTSARCRRAPQGHPRHLHRRDQPHHRWRARRGGLRPVARAALLRAHRDDAAGDGASVDGRVPHSAPAGQGGRRRVSPIVSGASRSRRGWCRITIPRSWMPTWRRWHSRWQPPVWMRRRCAGWTHRRRRTCRRRGSCCANSTRSTTQAASPGTARSSPRSACIHGSVT